MKNQILFAFLALNMGVGALFNRISIDTTQSIDTILFRREPMIFESRTVGRDPDSGLARAQNMHQNSGQRSLFLSRMSSFDSTATSRTPSPQSGGRPSLDATAPTITAEVQGPGYIWSTKGKNEGKSTFDSFHKVKEGEIRHQTWMHKDRVAVHLANKSGRTGEHSAIARGRWTGAGVTVRPGAKGTVTASTHQNREWSLNDGNHERNNAGAQAWQALEHGPTQTGTLLRGKGTTFIFADRDTPARSSSMPTHAESAIY